MEDFIENFNEFKDFLYEFPCVNEDSKRIKNIFIKKFEELSLNDSF